MNQNGGIHKGGFAVLCHRNGGSESPGILTWASRLALSQSYQGRSHSAYHDPDDPSQNESSAPAYQGPLRYSSPHPDWYAHCSLRCWTPFPLDSCESPGR